METRIVKKQTAFRLNENLVNRLKAEARRANRSLSNYVECILMESVYNEPNDETKAAIKEAKTGKYAGTIDMKDFDSFIKSVNDIE
ncbi:toxin-antitoxin system protein [uncultured Proteiniphilum sp.]|uniref:toxin-antitoxin system protein n=1 Tax=uncultured Proteiniphilum sp. TaxID=497637 RepID=UPI0026045047|nr:toxin-antitoxin system protein [uncultured Proteiniphilum sp.]